jgi:hypothetical protein
LQHHHKLIHQTNAGYLRITYKNGPYTAKIEACCVLNDVHQQPLSLHKSAKINALGLRQAG